jgi:sigma-B regulation protein RsbU (phosphoserine phosphatase)
LYDFIKLPDGRLAFFVGDVSGKGMPAALFMIAVRTLIRHLAVESQSPGEALTRLNAALAADNPSAMFVTLAHGIYHPGTGEIIMASGGHPAPLLRRASGKVEEVAMQAGRLLGYEGGNLDLADVRMRLAPGELLVFYTDGYTEAREPVARDMFNLERFQQVVHDFFPATPLATCAEKAKTTIEQFIRSQDLQDDLTLLLLRRLPASA